MTSVSTGLSPEQLQQAARDHLWLHFTRMSGYRDGEVPIIVRGDGCYLEDAHGKRYLDALAGLFAVQIGYSYGEEIGEAAAAQMRELPFYTNWSYAHPRAIELAAEVASLAPGDLNRVFFVSGGSEAVESAWKLARQYYSARGEHHRAAVGAGAHARLRRRAGRALHGRAPLEGDLAPRRLPRHDDGRALDQRHPGAAHAVRTARARGAARPQHEPLPPPCGGDRGGVHAHPARRAPADDRGHRPGDGLHGDHGAGAERRRRLHAARGLLARSARALRPLRDPALRRRGDHRLRPPRHLVRLGALRHPARPRHVRQGALLGVRVDRRGDRDRPRDGAVPRRASGCTRTGSRSAAIRSRRRSR